MSMNLNQNYNFVRVTYRNLGNGNSENGNSEAVVIISIVTFNDVTIDITQQKGYSPRYRTGWISYNSGDILRIQLLGNARLSTNLKLEYASVSCPNGIVGTDGICTPCRGGQEPNSVKTNCIDCPIGAIGTSGFCTPCGVGKIPNNTRTECV